MLLFFIDQVQFEVWLPLESAWSGRFAMVGNGVRHFSYEAGVKSAT